MTRVMGTTMRKIINSSSLFRCQVIAPSLLLLVGLVHAEEKKAAPAKDGEQVEVAAEPVEPLVDKLLQREYQRMPPLALKAMADVLEETVKEDVAQRFATDLQAGAWKSVQATLKKLSPEDAGKVYDHVLRQFVENNGELLPGEVIGLAEIAPGELNDMRLTLLGTILKNSISLVSTTGSLVARLEAGTGQFGGRDPVSRGRAAALLLAANRVIEAGPFLPPLDVAMAAKDYLTLDLHARFLAANGRERKLPSEIIKAWDLSVTILQGTDLQPAQVHARSRAAARCLSLLNDVPGATGDAWLRGIFTINQAIGQIVFAAVAEQITKSMEAQSEDERRNALKVQHRVVIALLEIDSVQIERWRTTLDLLTLGWLTEAALVYLDDSDEGDADGEMERYIRNQMKQYSVRPNQMQAYRNHFRNQYLENRRGGRNNNRNNNRDAQPLPIADLLASAPTPAWLALLDSSLAQRLRSLEGEFVCRSDDRERALALIKDLTTDEPQRAARLARSLVRSFTRSLQPKEDENDENGNRNASQSGTGIPLTRARQTRNLAQLATLLARIKELSVSPVPPVDVINAFVACHSPAEVFRAEDMTSVLGDPKILPTDMLVNLVSAMRGRLAGAWRKPNVQQQAKTQRSDAEVVAEVKRGYDVAKTICTQATEKNPNAWKLIQIQAALNFDHGEFIYGQQAPLAAYTALRDAAFVGYAKAARTYVSTLSTEQKPDITVYSQWFAAALGASDLSYLSRQQEADGDQVAAVRDAITGLPGSLAETHRELFARQVVQSLGEINAELKPRYLRHALRIIGDSPLAAEVRKIVGDYDDLLSEMQLDLSVDGATSVGHQTPFGAKFSLRHTTALGRESGGFSKYLQHQVPGSNGQMVSYRNDIEKHMREILSEHFTIDSITFHAADVASHGYGRDGWRELPLAYVVLRAKDPSIDRLPSLHIDLDFIDGHGAVILPVASGVTLIDARTTPAPRSAEVTGVDMTLDDRELSAGILRLEIRASGKGLLGELPTVLNPTVAGFTVVTIDDRGPAVSSMEVDGATVQPLCERLWQVQYAPSSGTIPTSFTFPAVTVAGLTAKLQRYHDADLLDATAMESLSPSQPWMVVLRPWLITFGLALLVALAAWFARRHRLSQPITGPRHVLPGRLTPFTVLAVLRAIHADSATNIDAAVRTRLAAVIADLEQRSFGRNGQVPNEIELGALAREWVK